MVKILDEVLKHIPKTAKVSDILFEGANIVIYTKNKDFFLDSNGTIKEIVDDIKKRVEIRPDPSITLGIEKAEEEIRKIIPVEADISKITFDPQRSRVIIESEKPGVAIGKQGELLKEIRRKTLWVPTIKRTPALRSKIIENIRQVLYENNDFRRKFLHKMGEQIYSDWKKEKRQGWIRVTFLGGARQVGKSCLLLQTPTSN
ncbi:MAG: KH domain-containing protein, partial [Candidatus Nanoarchaeia archaeon]|nr:KH domain-containing protein [Candidatus Nanoarchaeia archaeon]